MEHPWIHYAGESFCHSVHVSGTYVKKFRHIVYEAEVSLLFCRETTRHFCCYENQKYSKT